MQDKNPDKIFVKNALTPIEELCFARSYIEMLKNDVRHLQKERGELKAQIEDLTQNHKMTPEEKAIMKKDKKVIALYQANKKLTNDLVEARKDKEKLIIELIKLREKL